jgi:membrane fusion protein (multidrug efflux system)
MNAEKPSEPTPQELRNNRNSRRKRMALIILAVIAVAGAVFGYFYYRYVQTHISTDDAYITGRLHIISPRVAGMVIEVRVNDNQSVKKGEVLIRLDPADYEVRVTNARAALDLAKNQSGQDYAAVDAARARLNQAQSRLAQAQLDWKRAQDLFKSGAVSRDFYDKTQTDYRLAADEVRLAKENLRQAEAAIGYVPPGGQTAAVRLRQAALQEALLNQSYTTIVAPTDGYITKKSTEAGNYVDVGQSLMAVVSLDELWVVANYKETQLTHLKSGQPVTIKVDTFPGKIFTGKVDSIMAGTGAVFSLFPPENATGNYVKVVQRIPVKIVFDRGTDPQHVLRVGMSAVPTVYTGE